MSRTIELSVIVPVLNEAANLPKLLHNLAEQRDVDLEVVVCDGGSTDGTVEYAQAIGGCSTFALAVVISLPGRARQLNAGAIASSGETLLFLHADSLLPDPLALRNALDTLAAAITQRGHERLAGHFALRFQPQRDCAPSAGYYYFEEKARLNRRECTHGDQGFLLRRRFYDSAGGFEEARIPTETWFAESVRRQGEWLLLSAEIHTSPRRFEVEGLYERQVLNAILMNFAAMAWEPFFRDILSIYPNHDLSTRLDLYRLLSRIKRLIATLPLRQRLSLWYATGAYVRSHAWQVPFFFDTRRNSRQGLPPGYGENSLLALYDRYLDPLINHPPGRLAAALLTFAWFRLTCLHALLNRSRYSGCRD